MAFDYNFFQRWSDGVALDANSQWQYTSGIDNLATVGAAGYFNNVNGIVAGVASNEYIAINDVIYIAASDGANWAQVTAVSPDIAIAYVDPALGAGTVMTANLANQAVTAAKIANNTITDTQVSVNGLSGASLNISLVQYTRVAMTAAQFLAMSVTPYQLVAAQGAHTVIVVNNIVVEVVYGAAQLANGGIVVAQYGTTAAGAGPSAATPIAQADAQGWAANNLELMDGAGGLANIASAGAVNEGVYLSNTIAPFITGDSTYVIHTNYAVITTTV